MFYIVDYLAIFVLRFNHLQICHFIFKERRNVRRKYSILFLFLVGCLSALSWGVASAQNPPVDLSQIYISPNPNTPLVFNYPAGWVVDNTDPNFVKVSDPAGSLAIAFYTQALSESVINVSANEREGIKTFFQVAGVSYTGTETTVTLQNQLFVGAFNLDAVNAKADYALLGIGRGAEPPGWMYIHVSGNSVDVLGSVDTFMAIINTFGGLQTADGSTTSSGTTQGQAPVDNKSGGTTTTTTTTVNADPCTISTTQANTVRLRVGPGTNRGVIRFLEANRNFTVIGTANAANDNSKWWRLEKSEAAPTQAANEVWVADSDVTTAGGCDSVGTVAAPPIIRQRPTAVPTTTGGNTGGGNTGGGNQQPTPDPNSNQLFIDFYASEGRIQEGTCTTIFWDVRNAREVRLDGAIVQFQGSQTVCPVGTAPFSVEYFLDVIDNSDNLVTRNVFIQIDGGLVFCGFDEIPFFESSSVAAGGENYHYIFLDPCANDRTIWIEMFATGNTGFDPLLIVFIDDVYVGDDDDGGGFPHAYIEIFVPAGSNYISMTAKGFDSTVGGDYEILADYVP